VVGRQWRAVAGDPFWYTAAMGNGAKEYAAVVEFVAAKTAKEGVSSSRGFVSVDLSTGKPRLTCGTGVGAWKTLGTVADRKPLQADGATFTLQKLVDLFPNSRNPQTSIEVKHTAGPDVDVLIEVTDAAGKRVQRQNGEWSAARASAQPDHRRRLRHLSPGGEGCANRDRLNAAARVDDVRGLRA
jgi:hypothetical protein